VNPGSWAEEPALLALPAVAIVLSVLGHLLHWNAPLTATVTAVCLAASSVVATVLTRPYKPALVTGVVVTFLAAISHAWLHLSPTEISQAAVALTALLGYLVRVQVTPTTRPAPAPPA
jgi:hypothetical protein